MCGSKSPKSIDAADARESRLSVLGRRHTSFVIQDASCSRLSTLPFVYGPKRSMGQFLGAEKNNFFNSRYWRSRHDGRVDGILSICGPEVSRGSLLVGSRRAQAPIPHARRLPSVHTYKQGPLRSTALDHDLPKISIQSSLGSTKHRRMLSRGPPDPRYIPERVREPTYIRKKYVIWARWCPVPVKNVVSSVCANSSLQA